jgi:hypothetical protein
MEKVNCHFCNVLFSEDAPFCPQCGGPNEPDPIPWFKKATNRVKNAFLAKTESVWADRLASFMPLHFLASLGALIWIVTSVPDLGTTRLVAGIFTFAGMFACLVYYPDWYKNSPDSRKDYGLIYFLVLIAQAIITYNLLHVLSLPLK